MSERTVLEAQSRTVVGKKVKRLRSAGRIPATIYGHKVQSETIDVDARSFRQVHSSAGDNQLIDLVLNGKDRRPVLIHATQIDPRRNKALHIEFYQANLREKLTAHIPIHLVGEAPASRRGLMLLSNLDAIEVECLPDDLPQQLEVDVSSLEDVGAAIHVRDLDLDLAKCELKTPGDEVVIHVVATQAGTEEEGEAATDAETTAETAPSSAQE